jgi:hypothetical protein
LPWKSNIEREDHEVPVLALPRDFLSMVPEQHGVIIPNRVVA